MRFLVFIPGKLMYTFISGGIVNFLKKLVKTLKINKLDLTGKIEIEGKRKTRQNAENKQTLGI